VPQPHVQTRLVRHIERPANGSHPLTRALTNPIRSSPCLIVPQSPADATADAVPTEPWLLASSAPC
jgi:hypothetical protein